MKRIIGILAFVFMISSSYGQVDFFLGEWSAPKNDNSIVNIEMDEKGMITGTILSSDKKETIGHILLVEGEYHAEKNEIKGKLSRPKSSMKINVTISRDTDESIKLVGKKLFMKKTFNWNKIINDKE